MKSLKKFNAILSMYQVSLKQSLKGSEFLFYYVDRVFYKCR